MNTRVRDLFVLLAAVATLVLAPTAAGSPGAVVRDCAQDGSLDGSYSDADKRAALGLIPADLDEYSDCRAIIGGGLGGKGKVTATASSNGPPGAGATAAKDPKARKVAARKAKRAAQARRVRARIERERELGARAVDPRDANVFRAANTANGVTLPVALALIALGLLALAGTLAALWRGNPALAGVLRRVTPARFRR